MSRRLYRLHGWTVASDVELAAPTVDGAVDLSIAPMAGCRPAGELVLHRVVPGAEARAWRCGSRLTVQVGRDWWFRFDHHARLLQRWSAKGSEAIGLIILEGLGLAVALEEAGHRVLHASAVRIGQSAVGLVGPSGRGKSTTAALLVAAGAELLADDLLRLDPPDVAGEPWMAPNGSVRVRLRPRAEALAALLPAAGNTSMTADGRLSWQPAELPDRQLPIGALLLPCPVRTATRAVVAPCTPLQACQVLASGLRVAGHLDPSRRAVEFRTVSAIARAVPVGILRVPWGSEWTAALAGDVYEAVRSFTS